MLVRSKRLEFVLRIAGTHLERPFFVSAEVDSSLVSATAGGGAGGRASAPASAARQLELRPAGGDPDTWALSAGATVAHDESPESEMSAPSPGYGRHILVLAASLGDPMRPDRASDITALLQAKVDAAPAGDVLEISATRDLGSWLPNVCRCQRMRLAVRYMVWGIDAEAVRDTVPCHGPEEGDAAAASADGAMGFRLEAGLRIQAPAAAPALRVHSAVWGHVHDAAAQTDVALRLRSMSFECEPMVWAAAGHPGTLPRPVRRRIRRRRALLRRFRGLARTAGKEEEAAAVGRQLAEDARSMASEPNRYTDGFKGLGVPVVGGAAGSELTAAPGDSSDSDYAEVDDVHEEDAGTSSGGLDSTTGAAAGGIDGARALARSGDGEGRPAGAGETSAGSAQVSDSSSSHGGSIKVASASEAAQAKLLAFEKPSKVPLEAPGGAGPSVPLDGRDLLLGIVPPPRPGEPHPAVPLPVLAPGQSEFREASDGRWMCLRRGWDLGDVLGDPCPGQAKVLRAAWEVMPCAHHVHAKERNGRLLHAFRISGPVVAPRVALTRALWSHGSGASPPVDVTVPLRRRTDQLGGARAMVLPQENVYELLGLDRHGKPNKRAGAGRTGDMKGGQTTISRVQPDGSSVADTDKSDSAGADPRASPPPAASSRSSKEGSAVQTGPGSTHASKRLPRGAAARLGLGTAGMQQLRTVDPFGAEGVMARRMAAKGGSGGAATGYRHALDVQMLVDGVRRSELRLVDMLASTLLASGEQARLQARSTGQPMLDGAGGEGIMIDAGELSGPGGQPAVRIDRAMWGHPLDPSQRADVRSRLQSAMQRTRDGTRLDWPRGTPIDDVLGDPCPGTWRELHVRWTSEHIRG